MGYLTKDLPPELGGCPVDVFVSYSHGAFCGNSDSRLKRWSQQLALDLREELIALGLDDLCLFLDSSERADEGIDRTADLASDLRGRVEGAAVLAALISRPYLRSRWCTQERDWWSGRNTPDPLAVGPRLFPCRVWPTGEADWPDQLKGPLGFHFYDRDKPADLARPFGYGGTQADRDQYMAALVQLTGAIAQRLKATRRVLDERRREWEQQRKARAQGGQVLYLYAREEAGPHWDCACGLLQRESFAVCPASPEPLPANGGLDPEARAQLAASDGLLILGTDNERALDSDMVVVGRRYRHLAIAERGAPLPCAVFDTVGEGLQRERRLLNARNLGISWIDGTREDWPQRVSGWLAQSP
jgi:hypothetical protein